MSEKVVSIESVVNVVDVIGDIVADVRAEYDPDDLKKPYFMHGHPLEIIAKLKKIPSGSSKFPAIVLFEDFKAGEPKGIFSKCPVLNLVIITDTSQDYDAAQRYVKSFDTILTPIYDLFIDKILKSNTIWSRKRTIPHKPTNHLFWGKKGLYGIDGNALNGAIDAIEIENLELNIY